MTRTRSVGEIIAEHQGILGTVPPPGPAVCAICLGPKQPGYTYCIGCNRLEAGLPDELRTAAVPITTALNPSPWYSQLITYKNSSNEPWPLLASLLFMFLTSHADKLVEMLHGEPTTITIVPSKRGRQFANHPLVRVLGLFPKGTRVRDLPIEELLRYADVPFARQQYNPGMFAIQRDVRGERVLLIEDSYVSGATALSAAGELLERRARSVALIPIARVINAGFTTADHPYRTLMSAPFDINRWPRPGWLSFF